ncbi:MAG: prephenate dehydratase [Euryarchaeota archaeon HGW-Euryarchaeota-1]|nr:MAG: prephenate dehydratase [Euryarchaeota archaeon HGW-Euryarchaeota-1]
MDFTQDKPLIGIIGGTGKTGSQFKKFFEEAGYEVMVSSRKTSLKPEELAQKADILIYSVPIKDTIDIIMKTAPFAKPGALITDFTSVKTQPVEAMLRYAPESCEVVGMHPMFGPTIKSLNNQIVVLCKCRGTKWYAWLKNFLEKNSAVVKETTPQKHDKIMSVVQGITHFSSLVTARAIEKSGLSLKETLDFASPVYKLQLYTIGRILAQNPELYASIQMDNPEIRRRTEQFTDISKEISDIVKNKNYSNFVKKFNDVSHYFGNFKSESLEKTDYLIKRLVAYPLTLPKNPSLDELRKEIDKINNEFFALLTRREDFVKKVARLKKKMNLIVYDPDREKEILGKVVEKAKENKINPYEVRLFFENILNRSKELMQQIKTPEVYTLGPRGSYSEEMTSKVFNGKEIGFKNTIGEVFEEISKGDAIGVVPIENSTKGSVDETSLGFIKNPYINIIGEQILPINHCLIGFSWANKKEIKKIYSHTQTFGQCAQFLHKNFPNAEKIPSASNSYAVKMARQENERTVAAIASERASEMYGLKVLMKDIQDSKNNTTKFIILKKNEETEPTRNDRTSLLISYLEDAPGLLFGILKTFSERHINLSRVESFPSGEFGKYYFFIDLDGHIKDKIVSEALEEIKQNKNLIVRVLGSYKKLIGNYER